MKTGGIRTTECQSKHPPSILQRLATCGEGRRLCYRIWKRVGNTKPLNPPVRCEMNTLPEVLYISIPLSTLSYRPVRFRWYQGYLNGTDGHLAPQWALRNVILSPQCPELCNGHGRCTQEGSCHCDSGYQGFACETVHDPNPQDFHESFHGDHISLNGFLIILALLYSS